MELQARDLCSYICSICTALFRLTVVLLPNFFGANMQLRGHWRQTRRGPGWRHQDRSAVVSVVKRPQPRPWTWFFLVSPPQKTHITLRSPKVPKSSGFHDPKRPIFLTTTKSHTPNDRFPRWDPPRLFASLFGGPVPANPCGRWMNEAPLLEDRCL